MGNLAVHILENIAASPKRDMILARQGYHKYTTVLEEQHRQLVEKGMKEGMVLCEPKGAFARVKLKESADDVKMICDSLLESNKLSDFLSNSDEMVLMASTVGSEVVRRISREIGEGDAAFGLILDSVASQTADAGLDWIMSFLNKMLLKEGKKLTKHRFSPGYGDLEISKQKLLYDALKLEKLGLHITETFMLIPEKSVLAIAGIERIGIDE